MKDANGFLNGNLDPAVQAALGSGNRRQADRNMPREQRKKKLRDKAKGEARKGRRALYDLPELLIEEVKNMAAKYNTSASQIATLALWMFIQAEKNDGVDVRTYRALAGKNPKFEYVIVLPDLKYYGE